MVFVPMFGDLDPATDPDLVMRHYMIEEPTERAGPVGRPRSIRSNARVVGT